MISTAADTATHVALRWLGSLFFVIVSSDIIESLVSFPEEPGVRLNITTVPLLLTLPTRLVHCSSRSTASEMTNVPVNALVRTPSRISADVNILMPAWRANSGMESVAAPARILNGRGDSWTLGVPACATALTARIIPAAKALGCMENMHISSNLIEAMLPR
ncbi:MULTISPECIES: hypothetical protein [unclassified Massilia]|uniref:hypothetical protein n=1 Tax=unclassified Massilia TaxID=2609279 RepID=UPI0017862ACD|nr:MULTISPECIES: hypothetical protein [unclassified Massilia]MBD8529958.1 hypothetical protein [Massilia sp. CFBP 13647]MBD8673845.1 hypothetical protein [Massilia sp. CFBP 13721]